MPIGNRSIWLGIGLGLVIAGGLIAATVYWLDPLGWAADPRRFGELIDRAGRFAPLAYLGAGTLAFFVFLNSPAVWAAPSLFPLPLAYAYALAITLGPSFLMYAVAWVLGHEAVQQHVPPRIRRFEERMERRPLTTLILLRMFLWANPLVDVFIAMSNVSPLLYLGTSIAVLAFTTAIQIGIGMAATEGFEVAGEVPIWAWGALAAACLLLFLVERQRSLRRIRARLDHDGEGLLPGPGSGGAE